MRLRMDCRSLVCMTMVLAAGLAAGGGCASPPHFPAPVATRAADREEALAFNVRNDKQPDYWQYPGADGRIHALAYAANGTNMPGPRIDLDAIDTADVPHFMILLDGVPFEVVDRLYRAGSFRLFHPPARVICSFPGLTDVALADLMHTEPCLGFQSLYFDRAANRLSDSTDVYLSGRNSPWAQRMAYRCSFWWDTLVYLDPQPVFNHEFAGIADTFRKLDSGEAFAYSVGSASLGTRGGRPAMEAYLRTIDEFCERIVYERHGRVKLTLTADHGHNLVENRRITFDQILKAGGYHLTTALHGPRDVVGIRYGLVTYADFYTPDPAGVAECLLRHDDVEFTCYPSDETVVVRARQGTARIRKETGGYSYDVDGEDPLKLAPLIQRLRQDGKVSTAGEIDETALFQATVDHDYPDPLARIWRAFHGLVEHEPDVIVNLRDGACHGSQFFYTMVGRVASTHGSLNRLNSTTFVMTMLGDLPSVQTTDEVLPALERLRAQGSPSAP